jgi:hypothetical protein
MTPLPDGSEPPGLVSHHGFITPALRRDVADVNRQFLELALEPTLAGDPRFELPDEVGRALAAGGEALVSRVAACPFTLFRVALTQGGGPGIDRGSGVEDARRSLVDAATCARTHAFAHMALFLAWRLADDAPLALRFVLGLSEADELLLNETRPSDLLRLAHAPQLIGPRWLREARYWRLLLRAAASDTESTLRRVHCAGICLVVAGLRLHDAQANGKRPRR